MAKPVTKANTFASQNGPIPLSQLDGDFDTLYTAVNDPATYNNYLVDSGSANVIVVSYATGISYSAYAKGDLVSVKVAAGNSGATTINVNSLGAKTIKNPSGTDLSNKQLVAGGIYDFIYDGTNFQILGFDTGASPTITGNPKFAPTSGVVQFNSNSGSYAISLFAFNGTGVSFGLNILAGTNATDQCALFRNVSGATTILSLRGDGLVAINEANLGTTGLLNAATYEAGSFIGTLTGMTATTTGTVNWVRTGNIVLIYLSASITGTSNTTAMTMTGIPNAINPTAANQLSTIFALEDNGGGQKLGVANVQNNNTIVFGLGSGAAPITYSFTGFTNSGVKGIQSGTLLQYALQ